MKLIIFIVCTIAVTFNQGLPVRESETDSFLIESDIDQEYGHRLPQSTAPRVYLIEFDPDFTGESFTFTGNSTIFFEVLESTFSVILHRSDKITIDKNFTRLEDKNGAAIKPEKQKWSPWNEFYKIKFSQKLDPGNYSLKIKWSGIDASGSLYDFGFFRQGFFRAYDKIENKKHKYLVTTHFEPSGARSAFPCWDEPGFKAQFEISVKHFPNYTALSNMPEKSRQLLPDGRVITHFERSLKMSPYLPCVAVADYQAIKNEHGNITFYSSENNLDSLKFALEISEKVIPIMEAYTGVPYTLPKLDQIAISQYKGGMEHWGLVSYETSSVKLESTSLDSDLDSKYNILIIVAHELAHQWFGNLVTPVWWDDTWLNEAFAAYFESKIIDQIYPNQHIMDYFVVNDVNYGSYDAEKLFSSKYAKPIKWNPKNKVDLRKIFSPVTYRKGAAVIHMLEHIITEEIFREGLQRYFKAHQFGTVVTDDLWRAFQEEYDKKHGDNLLDIKKTMDPWIMQTGTPIVTVTRNYDTGETNLTQRDSADSNSGNKWNIPINYATESNPDFSSVSPTTWLNEDEEMITLENIEKNDWIILNIQQRGFYQVNYDRENWRRLAEFLTKSHEKIHPINRAQLIVDSVKLLADDLSYVNVFFNITTYLYKEKNLLPWTSVAEIMSAMAQIFRNTNAEHLYKMYTLFLTRGISEDDTFEEENFFSVKIKNILAHLLCDFEQTQCRSRAHRLFINYLENPSKNISDWIICSGLQESNETVWKKFMTDQDLSKNFFPYSKYSFIKCRSQKEERDKYMNEIIGNSTLSSSSVTEIFKTFLNSSYDNVNYIMQHFFNHFDDIQEFYIRSDINFSMINITSLMISAIKTQDQYDKMDGFIKVNKDKFEDIFSELPTALSSLLRDAQITIKVIDKISAKFRELVIQNFLIDDYDNILKKL